MAETSRRTGCFALFNKQAQTITAIVLIISAVELARSIFNIEFLQNLFIPFQPMKISTSFCFFVFGGQLMRKIIPAMIVLPIFLAIVFISLINAGALDFKSGFAMYAVMLASIYFIIIIYALKLQLAQSEAEKANQAKSSFLSQISHEIRNPMGVIIGLSNMIQKTKKLDAATSRYLDTICRNGNTILNLLNDLLDISKIEAHKLKLSPIVFSPKKLVKDVLETMEFNAQEKNLNLTSSYGEGLPEQVIADPMRLRQILVNLLSNSIKFTDSGYVHLAVDCTKTLKLDGTQQKMLSFTVSDSGCGIHPDSIPNLFKYYSQSDASVCAKHGGTGLGLILSKNLAQAMGGNLILQATSPQKGSTFVASISFEEVKQSHLKIESNVIPSISESFTSKSPVYEPSHNLLKGKNILVVEDSEDNRMVISAILESYNATIDTANNGSEGIKKALSNNYDYILMDIQMPVKNGADATKDLRTLGYLKPIMALTAHAFKDELEQFKNAGFTDFVTKPINIHELLSKLAQARNVTVPFQTTATTITRQNEKEGPSSESTIRNI